MAFQLQCRLAGRKASAAVIVSALLSLVSAPLPLRAQSSPVPHFESDIAPIFAANCFNCHGESPQQANLDVRTLAGLLVGGQSGPALAPRDPVNSLLLQKIASGAMPVGPEQLDANEIDLVRRWIEAGAPGEKEDSSRSEAARPEVSSREITSSILAVKCLLCHGRRRQEGGLDLRTRSSALKGGVSGPAIVLGQPDESLLIKRIVAEEMPPQEHQARLSYRPITSSELENLKLWISNGAAFDEEASPSVDPSTDPLVSDKDRTFWSFVPPRRPAAPRPRHNEQVRTPIDAFLLEKLEEKNLQLSPEAGRLALMRRVYFDVTGLPPSPEEVETYLADRGPQAYENLVDRLLNSPRYGEHWARRWLDAAGYADSEGQVDFDAVRPHAWRYRDWVIRSLNSDKPYDQFLLEQIAGDELFDYAATDESVTPEQRDLLIATGFLRMAPDGTYSVSQAFVPERLTVVADQVQVLTSSVMGLTMACARCHDHKYDPLPQRDYYRFSAILRSAYDPYDWLSPNEADIGPDADWNESNTRLMAGVPPEELRETKEFNAPALERVAKLQAELDQLAAPLRQQFFEKKLAGIPEIIRGDLRSAIDAPAEERTETQQYLVARFSKNLEVTLDQLTEGNDEFKKKRLEIETEIAKHKRALRPSPRIRALFDMGGRPTPVRVLFRGEFNNPGPLVEPGVPSVFGPELEPYQIEKPQYTSDTSGRRLALAKWLIQPNHPLTSRVMVNRVWQHYFGTGIVAGDGNFGRSGPAPSHPELLDWLATEFVAQGWSLKSLHRLILNSAAYRQSSLYDDRRHRDDPNNVLISRFPLRRLEAEAVRDSVLKAAGRLDATPYGPPDDIEVQPDGEVIAKDSSPVGQRRSIYLSRRRSKPVTILEVFDAPQLNPNCLRRTQSTVSAQALQMMNSEEVRANSRFMAGRVIDAAGENAEDWIERAYLTALSRPPTEAERADGVSVLSEMSAAWMLRLEEQVPMEPKRSKAQWLALATFCHALMNSAEFLYLD